MASSSGGAGWSQPPRKRVRLLYARRVSLFSALVALPATFVSGLFIWFAPWSLSGKLTLFFLILFVWWLLAMALQEHATRPLQTLANVVAALREEDYSFRARNAVPEDALGELSLEVNALADMLSDQRIRAIEATALVQRIVEEIDTPLFAFDPDRILRIVNSAGERLLQQPAVRLTGLTAAEIGLDECLHSPAGTLLTLPSANSNARWLLRRSSFRQRGVPHTLVVLSDVSRALREEEKAAWQRLVRVLGHELNNSLAPIKSIAGSLQGRIAQAGLSAAESQDFARGLEIIETRAAALNRFLQAYRQLAQMPPPVLQPIALSPVLLRVAALETRLNVRVESGGDTLVLADPDQLEQMLINLVRNAAEAALEAARARNGHRSPLPAVTLAWRIRDGEIAISIDDNGPGILNSDNLFIPFYTTKPNGTGVGLVLSRQIAEAQGGRLELSNRQDHAGCVATVTLRRPASGA